MARATKKKKPSYKHKTTNRVIYYPPLVFQEFNRNCALEDISLNKKLIQFVIKYNEKLERKRNKLNHQKNK